MQNDEHKYSTTYFHSSSLHSQRYAGGPHRVQCGQAPLVKLPVHHTCACWKTSSPTIGKQANLQQTSSELRWFGKCNDVQRQEALICPVLFNLFRIQMSAKRSLNKSNFLSRWNSGKCAGLLKHSGSIISRVNVSSIFFHFKVTCHKFYICWTNFKITNSEEIYTMKCPWRFNEVSMKIQIYSMDLVCDAIEITSLPNQVLEVLDVQYDKTNGTKYQTNLVSHQHLSSTLGILNCVAFQ